MDQQTLQDLSSTGHHQECLQACQQLLQSEPESPLPWKYAGKSLLALGKLEKSQQCLAKAHHLDTNDPETTKDIGNYYLKIGSTDTAIEWYKKSLEINNNYAPAINNIANIKRQCGNNQEAVKLFKRAIQADPEFVQAYIGAAVNFLTLGDLDQAESFANQAIEINASLPGTNEILGIIFQNQKNSQQAIESYQKELAINPKSSTSLLNLGLLLLQQGKAAAAIEPLATAAAINPSEQCSLLLAQAYQNVGRLKEAIAKYKKLNISKSQDKTTPFNLGLCLLKTGSNIDAIEAFKIAINLDESFLPAWGNIGTALMNEGRHQEALPATQKVLELDPNNPTAHMNLGSIYKNLGNLDQALSSTLKSLELKPDNPDALINLGGIYKDLGKLEQALSSTLKSLELRPDNPDALINLGGIYQDLGKLDQALSSTLKSLELKPHNPTAHMNLGITHETLNELDNALESYTQSAQLIATHKEKSSLTSLINISIILLQMNRIEHAKIAQSRALKIALNQEIILKPVSAKNKINNNAYLSYLGSLIPEIPIIDSSTEPQILHIGDSHCLTFTNQTIDFKGKECTIKPSLVKGTKAYHLSEFSKPNPQKAGFEKRLQKNIDDYEYIFLSFGEIDCREDEGILLHCKKTGEAIQDVSKSTAIKYYKWTATSLSKHKKKLVYFGTPAPFKTNLMRKESSQNDKQRLLAITVFNTNLARQCQESGVLFADIYKLTADKDGYNNRKWMIDSRHLKPKALNELIKRIKE